jgi:3-phosphoshikimate 1-carboxyvinyltransferase
MNHLPNSTNQPNPFQPVLPYGKSEANRMLILQYLAKGKLPEWSGDDWPEDVKTMLRLLKSKEKTLNVGPAGTVARFLTAALAIGNEERCITGSERMQLRPMQPLIYSLRSIGCSVSCQTMEGFLPLTVGGKLPTSEKVDVRADISSQFISALLMIAPFLEKGLEISTNGQPVSSTYISLTINTMSSFGVKVEHTPKGWKVMAGAKPFTKLPYPEKDWAAASYWLLAAIATNQPLRFSGLLQNSIQPDAHWLKFLPELGLSSKWEQNGDLSIQPSGEPLPNSLWKVSLDECPDLTPTLAMAARLRQRPFHFEGLQTLNKKESNRIEVLHSYLRALGANPTRTESSLSCLTYGPWPSTGQILEFSTYEDHRMAMALAVLQLKGYKLALDNSAVVEKSYPDFWRQWELHQSP